MNGNKFQLVLFYLYCYYISLSTQYNTDLSKLINTSKLHSGKIINSYQYYFNEFSSYGNEYHQANQYFSYIDNNPISKQYELDTFKQYDLCFINDQYSSDISKIRQCTIDYNIAHENITSFYSDYISKYTSDPYKRSQDCDYNISHNSLVNINSTFYLKFYIHEHKCKSNLSIPSGSSFDVFAITDHSLITCKQFTFTNNSRYAITCILSEDKVDVINSNICMNITIILTGMNFDNFNEYIRNGNRRYYRLIWDNQRYCINPSEIKSLDDNYAKTHENKNNKLWYYSGEWVNDESYRSNNNQYRLYQYDESINMNTGVPNHILGYNYSEYRHYNRDQYSDTFGRFPQLFYSLDKINKYIFKPKIILPYNHSLITPTYDQNYYNILKLLLLNSNKHFFFIGSSHLRYSYDAILTYINPDNDFTVYNDNEIYFNFHNNALQLTKYHFASYQADHLLALCNVFESNKSSNISYSILFQTGSWDLASMPLSKLLRDSSGITSSLIASTSLITCIAKKLINALTNILSGHTRCGNLHHFIWLTNVPITTCFSNYEDCEGKTVHRINAAIAASNQFYLKHLRNVNTSDNIKFSIIDAYSIIKPRLILNQYSENVCNNHYLCLEQYDGKNVIKMVLVHTPSGDAMIEIILLALISR